MPIRPSLSLRFARAATALAAAALLMPVAALAADRGGDVYVMTNQTSANSVMVYHRAADGQLSYSGEFATGGTGAGTGGDPLASQGALVLRGNLLFAVNAGSNDISMFRVDGDKLDLVDRVASGGPFPVSLAVKGQLAHVLNAGSGSISSIAIGADGQLELLNGAAGSLVAPLDMAFSANDRFLYARDGDGAVTGFGVHGDGSLSYVTTLGGIPAGAQGIAAR
jgi:hypothetical protein